VLVAGGAGFIGSHLCDRLVAQGHEVTCVDNFYSGRRENITHLLGEPNFTLIEHDVIKPLSVTADRIFNLACPASPLFYQRDPVYTVRTCVEGSRNLLELARETGATILQASTSEVYGDPEIHPQPEDYRGRVNPVGTRGCYAEGKRCAEALFFDYYRLHEMKIKIARIFNTYGPRMRPDDGRVIANFITRALNERPLTIHGDGRQTRSFCYVDDMVDGLLKLMETRGDITGPMNLGCPVETSILDLARLIVRESGSTSALEHDRVCEDDPRCRRPDISLARGTMGWEPKVSLENGIRIVVDHFRGQRDAAALVQAESGLQWMPGGRSRA